MFLAQWNNDVSMIPVHVVLPDRRPPARVDGLVSRSPSTATVLTIREYQTRWLGVFASISGQPIRTATPAWRSTCRRSPARPPNSRRRTRASHHSSFPVLGPSRIAVPDCDDATEVEVADGAGGQAATDGPSRADIEAAGLCTEQAPGIVFGVKLQPVLAVADGVVTDVRDEPGSGEPITVTVTDADGTQLHLRRLQRRQPGHRRRRRSGPSPTVRRSP